jgi:hypothetical protein
MTYKLLCSFLPLWNTFCNKRRENMKVFNRKIVVAILHYAYEKMKCCFLSRTKYWNILPLVARRHFGRTGLHQQLFTSRLTGSVFVYVIQLACVNGRRDRSSRQAYKPIASSLPVINICGSSFSWHCHRLVPRASPGF